MNFHAINHNVDNSTPGMHAGDSIQITTFRFYTGRFRFFQNDSLLSEDPSYHLVDLSSVNTSMLEFPEVSDNRIDSVAFLIGVDSTTQLRGALGGDLDPTQGMYWSWQSGYIDFKLEGNVQSADASTKAFELHIGGYSPPFATQREVVLHCHSDSAECTILLYRIFEKLPPNQYHIMSPGASAAYVADLIHSSFTCTKD